MTIQLSEVSRSVRAELTVDAEDLFALHLVSRVRYDWFYAHRSCFVSEGFAGVLCVCDYAFLSVFFLECFMEEVGCSFFLIYICRFYGDC